MPDIGNVQGPGQSGRIRPVGERRDTVPLKAVNPSDEQDRVEISVIAEMLGKIRDLPDVRVEKVAPIRQAIQAGTYDVESRLDVAIERLLEDLD
jgi:anti-sigma28 factor (negative regulator of flagellin synthesis)